MKRVKFTATIEAYIDTDDDATVQEEDEFTREDKFVDAMAGADPSGMEILDELRDISILSVEEIAE